MGLLSEGTPLDWESTQREAVDIVHKHGITQFLNLFARLKNRRDECLKFGDEIEYIVASLDPQNKTARVTLRAADVLEQLNEEEHHATDLSQVTTLWRPEYGRYMIEGTPGKPYAGAIRDFLSIEGNMKLRRNKVQSLLLENEVALTITNFPRLGCKNFTEPPFPPYGPAAKSLFFPDEAITAHKRFPTLSQNIRERRKSRVAINIPIFKDKNTPSPFIEDFPNDDGEAKKAALPDHIYMDAMGFGMGCCCLQVTFQACSISEARYLYDQLAVISPILLAVTAATPIFRGYLSDIDVRWSTISMSVDDRTEEERGLKPLSENKYVIPKSRYDSIDCFISDDKALKAKEAYYNDITVVKDDEAYKRLVADGVDSILAKHIAHLFIRDPLVVYKERLNQDDENESDHFENIQSTNWQTMRFKPPPPKSSIGWRVEFRVMEVQLTDFENAAFTIFIVLLTRAILAYDLLFYIPISKVEENMKFAHKRDAVKNEKFYFRKDLSRNGNNDNFELMDIKAIMNGSDSFPGLIPLVYRYLDNLGLDSDTRSCLNQYLGLIEKRSKGELQTPAAWIRSFVMSHPDYKNDSVVSESISYDLLSACNALGNGVEGNQSLLGQFYPREASHDAAYQRASTFGVGRVDNCGCG